METIEKFADIDYDYISGSGDGSGNGSEDGSGYGYGSGSGYDSGYGYGSGSGYGPGYGSGNGNGYGDGSGYGYGYGYVSVYDKNIKSFEGHDVYMIDKIPTIIDFVRDNIAKGYILQSDFTLKPCYIVKENNYFAHGDTLHDAFESLQEKLYDNSSEKERIEKFKVHFSDFSVKYPAKELFIWHHVLTGSCKTGRKYFCNSKGINIDTDKFTIYEFIELTKNSYGGEIIKKLLY